MSRHTTEVRGNNKWCSLLLFQFHDIRIMEFSANILLRCHSYNLCDIHLPKCWVDLFSNCSFLQASAVEKNKTNIQKSKFYTSKLRSCQNQVTVVVLPYLEINSIISVTLSPHRKIGGWRNFFQDGQRFSKLILPVDVACFRPRFGFYGNWGPNCLRSLNKRKLKLVLNSLLRFFPRSFTSKSAYETINLLRL